MSDEQNVGAGSEPSGDQPVAEPSQEAPVASDPAAVDPAPAEATPAAAPAEEQPAPEPAAENAGGAAEQTNETVDAPAPEQPQPEDAPVVDAPPSDMRPPVLDSSRTGFVDAGLRPGDACTCPDGRLGTVHAFAGNPLICIPNQG